MWSQVDIQLQQKTISPDIANHYAYKAYLDSVLYYGNDAKATQLTGQCFFKDDSTQIEATDPEGEFII
jgi:hypothetical protein